MKTSGKDMNEDDNSIKQKGNVCTQWWLLNEQYMYYRKP